MGSGGGRGCERVEGRQKKEYAHKIDFKSIKTKRNACLELIKESLNVSNPQCSAEAK